jgi:hypothetical protein
LSKGLLRHIECGGTLQRTGTCQTCTSSGYNTGCGLERRVVAEALVAPGVVVDAGRWLELGRGEYVVEAPAAAMTGDALPGPARFAGSVVVERAVGVAVAEVPQSGNDAELGFVPVGSALGS